MKYGSDKMNIKRKILETIGQIMYWYAEIIDKFLNGTIGKAMDAYDKKEEENMIIMIDDEKCAKCNKLIDDKDFTMSTESREYWGRPSCEDICIGYKCSKCGHEEKF